MYAADHDADARSLIRGMLQQEPSQRLDIEGILTHPWFKLTHVDKLSDIPGDSQSLPPTPGPGSPLISDKAAFFSEPFHRCDSGTPSARYLTPHSSLPSPLTTATQAPKFASLGKPESEPSETSVELADSDYGKPDSGLTTPTTAEDEDVEPIKRNHSGEFSQTEQLLESLHQNGSQSTIRRPGSESPSSTNGSYLKNKVAVRGPLEGQTEVDEDTITDDELLSRDRSASYASVNGQSYLSTLAHSRTPSRTKRRSVSSTMSLERRQSYHSTSQQWQTYFPEDYLAQLNAQREQSFSTPSERYLLDQLSGLGFDVGQLMHSVKSDACDSSAGTWWMLRQKQLDRGETDEMISAKLASAARRQKRAAAYAREERRQARAAAGDEVTSHARITTSVILELGPITSPMMPNPTPRIAVMGLGAPLPSPGQNIVASPENVAVVSMPIVSDAFLRVPELKSVSKIQQTPEFGELSSQPQTPPHDSPRVPQFTSGPESSPNRSRSTRSPSMSSMLQRATSALVGGGKKLEDIESPVDKKFDARSISPTKSMRPTSNLKLARNESETTFLDVPQTSPMGSVSSFRSADVPSQPEAGPSRIKLSTSEGQVQGPSHDTFSSALVTGKVKASKRDSLWSTFRQLFVEDKRRRKGELSGQPLAVENLKITPAVVLSRGISARTPHVNRFVQQTNGNSVRRVSVDARSALYSRRSSSVNSRRSSVSSIQAPVADLRESLAALGPAHSRWSHGSQTPNSEREYQDHPSRPTSAHSVRRASRRSSQTGRSPSMQSDVSGRFHPASPLHNYHRRPSSGSASTRVKHFKVIPEAQVLRSGSRASSTRSNASSCASSIDRSRGEGPDSGYDTGRDEMGIRSKQRRSTAASLTSQMYRTRSPLVKAGQEQEQDLRSKPKAPLRDVFQQNDDQWVSDEDQGNTGFAGGVGQGNTAVDVVQTVRWSGAAAHPNSLHKQRVRNHRHGQSRSRKGSSDEEKEKKGVVVNEVQKTGGSRRAGLPGPDKRGGRAPDIKEEEEEEE